MQNRTRPTSRVLVIKHGAFGDIVQTQGALADIRDHYREANISVLSDPNFSRLWARCPYVDSMISDSRAPLHKLGVLRELRRDLRRFDPDVVIDLQNTSRTNLYRKCFLRGSIWSFIESPRSQSCKYPKSMSSLLRLSGQLSEFGVVLNRTQTPEISWLCNDVGHHLSASNVQSPYVVLIPGSSARHPQKRWSHYDVLATKLQVAGFDVVTVPGPGEHELCGRIPGKVLTGNNFLDWFDFAGILNGAEFVVGNDTGPSHIAAHLDRPGLALFSSHTSAEATGILTRRMMEIEVDDLSVLTVDTVWQKLTELNLV